MSRCFPFPPPGYEKKLNLDDANLLAKAKHKEKKEKKHKKDKKDKEKKEGKEKDKDRSKKKEKKEKHRDKNPEKNNPGDEKRIEGHVGGSLQSNHLAESSHVQELARRIKDDDGATGRKTVDRNTVTIQMRGEPLGKVAANNVTNQSERKETLKDKSACKNNRENIETRFPKVAIVHSLGGVDQKRVDIVKSTEKDVTKAAEWKEKEKTHVSGSKGDKNNDRDDRKITRQTEQLNGNNFVSNKVQNRQIKENGSVHEFEGRVRDGHAAPKGQFVDKNIGTDQKRAGAMGQKNVETAQKRENVWRLGDNSTLFSEGKGVSSNGNGFYSKASGQSDKSKVPKVSFVHNFSRGAEQKRVEGLEPMEKGGTKRTADGKEKFKQEERDTASDRDGDGKHRPIGGDKSMEKTEVKVREGGEPNKNMFRIKEIVRETGDGSKSSISKDINKISAPEGNAKKRKQPEINGYLHDNDIRPSKLQRPASSCHPPVENGRKLDVAISIAPPSAPKEKGTALNHKIQVKKEHKLNGVNDLLQSTVNTTMSPSHNQRSSAASIAPESALKGKGNAIDHHKLEAETKINGFLDPCKPTVNLSISSSAAPIPKKRHKAPSVKPPHPDTKYLSEILSVPKLEDMVEPDVQDWLFNSSQKKPQVCSSEPETHEQVWDKALRIESADVCVLPYVIPY